MGISDAANRLMCVTSWRQQPWLPPRCNLDFLGDDRDVQDMVLLEANGDVQVSLCIQRGKVSTLIFIE